MTANVKITGCKQLGFLGLNMINSDYYGYKRTDQMDLDEWGSVKKIIIQNHILPVHLHKYGYVMP